MGLAVRLQRWDRALTGHLTLPPAAQGRRALAMLVAHSGDSALWIVGALLAIGWGREMGGEVGRRVLLATFVGGSAVWLLKHLFRRRRPSDASQGLYLGLDVHSFPSGHAGRNACSAVLLWPLLSPWLQAGLLVWLVGLGLSRVALGVHYVSDVLAGFAVGGGIGCLLPG